MIYDLFVEYNIHNSDQYTKYTSSCFEWYKKKHQASITGVFFNEEKPAKSLGETFDRTKAKAKQIVGEVKSIDTAAIKAKIGGFWNKIRGREQEPTPNLQSHDPDHENDQEENK